MVFVASKWCDSIDVRDFIMKNYSPYVGDDSFLAPATERTKALWNKVSDLMKEERARGGVYDVDVNHISTVTAQLLYTNDTLRSPCMEALKLCASGVS